MAAGTTPSTARSLYSVRHTTTGWMCPGTLVTLAIRSVDTAVRSSPHMIVTTTRGATVGTGTTVQCCTAADAGSPSAETATSTMLALMDKASYGRRDSTCGQHACGWHARSITSYNSIVTSSDKIKLHCVSKNIPDVFSYNSRKHCWIFKIFGRNVTEKVICYIFTPHLINASALPCETENMESVSVYVNVSCWVANRHTSHIGIIT